MSLKIFNLSEFRLNRPTLVRGNLTGISQLDVRFGFSSSVNPDAKQKCILVHNPSLIQQKSELIILKSDQMNQNPARN